MSEATSPVEAFLDRMPTLVLSTIRADGSPQSSPVWYLWNGGEFSISTVTRTAKWHNLKRDPRCSICVEDPATGQMVVAYGTAELREVDVWTETLPIVTKYYPEDPVEASAHMERIFSADDRRVIVAVRPAEIITRRLDS